MANVQSNFKPNRGEVDRAIRDLGQFTRDRASEFANVYPGATVQMQTTIAPEKVNTRVEVKDRRIVSRELDQANLMRRIDEFRTV